MIFTHTYYLINLNITIIHQIWFLLLPFVFFFLVATFISFTCYFYILSALVRALILIDSSRVLNILLILIY